MSDEFFLAPMQVTASLFDTKGRPNLPMRKLWDKHRFAIGDQFTAQGVIIDDLSATQDDLADAQAQLMTVVFEMDDVQADLAQTVDDLAEAFDEISAINTIVVPAILNFLYAGQGASGYTTVFPNGFGQASIPFSYTTYNSYLPARLQNCTAQSTGGAFCHVQLIGVTNAMSGSLTIALFDAAGAPITSGAFDIVWRVGGA